MARSLFRAPTLRGGFVGRYRPDFAEDEWPRTRYAVDSTSRRRFKWPWIYRYIGYHLMAAFGIVIAFIAWLLIMARG